MELTKAYGTSDYRPANTSIAAEARRPTKLMSRISRSPRRSLTVPLPPDRFETVLSGSATQIRTNKNSNGACSHEAANKRFNIANPPISQTSIKVAPRLKNPISPPVNNEKPVSRIFLVEFPMGGVHRTFAIINGYRKESETGKQLFAKTSNITTTPPKALASRTGAIARAFTRKTIPSRNTKDDAVSSAPASDPMTKATVVATKARSMNFISTTSAEEFFFGGGFE